MPTPIIIPEVYDERNQNHKWKDDLAKTLNYLLIVGKRLPKRDEAALRDVLTRVAEYEELKKV